MGRKRTGKDKGSAKEKDSLATADSVEATEQTCTSPEPEDPTTPTQPQLSNSAHSEDLSVAEQLKVAQQEIESMKAQLAAKDVEIASLRASQGLVSSANPSDSNRNAEMNKLRDRLSSLKREQQEADSARTCLLKGQIDGKHSVHSFVHFMLFRWM